MISLKVVLKKQNNYAAYYHCMNGKELGVSYYMLTISIH